MIFSLVWIGYEIAFLEIQKDYIAENTLESSVEMSAENNTAQSVSIITETPFPTPTITLSPTGTPVPTVTQTFFTAYDAEQIVLSPNCGYTVNYAIRQDGIDSTKTYNLEDYPSGYIIGDAVLAEIDGHTLGTAGVTFIIELTEPEDRHYLKIKSGMFFVVAPENAEGWLRLRQLHLECKGKYREPVRYP